jgi:hypothetical protein
VLPWALFLGAGVLSGLLVRWWWPRPAPTPVSAPLLPTVRAVARAPAARAAAATRQRERAQSREQPEPGFSRPVVPEPRRKRRPESEWQGMLIDVAVAPTCDVTEHCSRGQVCKPGACGPGEPPGSECLRCLPCESDGECLLGELCVLDHCVKEQLVECRLAKDCGGVSCILTDYSTGPRNNDEMRAHCAEFDTGTPTPEEEPKQLVDNRPPPLAAQLSEQVERSLREDP